MEEFFLAALNLKDDELIWEIGKNIANETQPGNKRDGNKLFTGDFEDQLTYFSKMVDDKLYQETLSHFLKMASLERTLGFSDLLDAYDKVIKEGAPPIFYKRRIEILISDDLFGPAIHDVCDYLMTIKPDPSLRPLFLLSDFYSSEYNYVRAKSCIEQLILSHPDNYLCYLKLVEIEFDFNGQYSKGTLAYFEKASELRLRELKKEGHSGREDENDEYQVAVNWAFNRLKKYFEKQKPQRKSKKEIVEFLGISLFCIILIYNFYSYFQLVILIIFVINLLSVI